MPESDLETALKLLQEIIDGCVTCRREQSVVTRCQVPGHTEAKEFLATWK